MESKAIRINLRISPRVKNYFDKKCEETGVPRSCIMALALEEYIDQKSTITCMENGGMEQLLKFATTTVTKD